MTAYILFEVTLILSGYIYLMLQFRAGSKKHTGSITEVVESGESIEMLITQYWNILLALLCCVFFLTRKSAFNIELIQVSPWIPIIICLIALFVSMSIKVPVPMHKQRFSSKEMRYYLVIRGSYLVFYEWFFRGLVLQVSLEYFPVSIAISINILLYTLAHIYSPKREIIACIPLGLLFCWLRLEYASVLFPVILHLCMALPFELRILRSSSLHYKNIKQ